MKDLPFSTIIDKKGAEAIFMGKVEKGQPKGVGLKYLSNNSIEFGFYGDQPFTVYWFYPDKKKLTIIPNINKPMKTQVHLNGVVVSTCGKGNTFVKMTHPDGWYYQGGYDNATGNFKGIGKYWHSNGDIFVG